GLLKDRLRREGRPARSEVCSVITPTGSRLRIVLQLDDLYLTGFGPGPEGPLFRFRGLKRWDGPEATELAIDCHHRALKTAERAISLDVLRRIDRLNDYRGQALHDDHVAALSALVVAVSEGLRFSSVRQAVTGILGGQIRSLGVREMAELVRTRFREWN